MKVVMRFDIPEDKRFLEREMGIMASRMFEAASNACVDPFIGEELFDSSSLEIDGDLVKGSR